LALVDVHDWFALCISIIFDRIEVLFGYYESC
jgi:hypothetical protein